MSYLGLDIGTSGCKAAVFLQDGTLIRQAYREYSLEYPYPGHAELDSRRVMQHCFEVIKEVNASINEPVTAMCISSQGEAFTALDNDGNILCNAMVSSDNRALNEVTEFEDLFGKEVLYKITGHTAHPMFTLFKLLWLKKNNPEVWKKARYFLCFEDLFIYHMGLEPSISWPLAGRTMMFDIKKHSWSEPILKTIGLNADKLSKPFATGSIIGPIRQDIGRLLGFTKDVIVVAGGHDQPVNALGAGITKSGECMYATGTVECFCPMLDKITLTPQLMGNNLCCYDFTTPGKFTTVAYSLTGGSIIKWFRDEFGAAEKAESDRTGKDVYSLLLEQIRTSPTDLIVLPYLCPTGTPYFDAKASGAIIGIKQTTKRSEILKSLLEGITMEMRLNMQLMEESGMQVDSFIATGGGTRNAAWNQLKADILNRPVRVSHINETGCYGAAMIACSAETGKDIAQIISDNETAENVFLPNERNAGIYNQKFEVYRSLYPALRPLWNAIPETV